MMCSLFHSDDSMLEIQLACCGINYRYLAYLLQLFIFGAFYFVHFKMAKKQLKLTVSREK